MGTVIPFQDLVVGETYNTTWLDHEGEIDSFNGKLLKDIPGVLLQKEPSTEPDIPDQVSVALEGVHDYSGPANWTIFKKRLLPSTMAAITSIGPLLDESQTPLSPAMKNILNYAGLPFQKPPKNPIGPRKPNGAFGGRKSRKRKTRKSKKRARKTRHR